MNNEKKNNQSQAAKAPFRGVGGLQETRAEKRRRYNLHYKLRKLGYIIRLADWHIIRPAGATARMLKLESKLTIRNAYCVSENLM